MKVILRPRFHNTGVSKCEFKFAIAIAYSFIAVVTLFQPGQANAQKLVLYFPFEGNGDIVDEKSGQNNHGKFDNGKAKRVASKDKNLAKLWNLKNHELSSKQAKILICQRFPLLCGSINH